MGTGRVLARGQRAAKRRMVDTCTIRRSTGDTTDPNTGVVTATWKQLYAGRCRVQHGLAQAAQHDTGQDSLLLVRLQVHLPMTVVGLEVNDQITITTSRDPDLVGRVFLVRDLFHKTDATARRVGVTERTG